MTHFLLTVGLCEAGEGLLDASERALIETILEHNPSKRHAARVLGISPKTLYARMRLHRIGGDVRPERTEACRAAARSQYTRRRKLALAPLLLLAALWSPARAACVTSNGSWQAFPFQSQAGQFTFDADLTPLAQGLDSLVCLSKGVPTGVSSCAVILRFATDNQIDARDGGVYADLDGGGLPYTAGTLYHAHLIVNVATHTYEVEIGDVVATPHPFAFRTEQANVPSLDTWSVRRITGTGSHETCDATVSVTTSDECDPCDPKTLGAPASCATWTSDMSLAKADGWVVLARETGGTWKPVIKQPWVKYAKNGKLFCAGYGFNRSGSPPPGCDMMAVLPYTPLTRWWSPVPGKLYDVTFRLYSDAHGWVDGPLVQNVEPMASDCGGEGHRWETICGPRLWPAGKCP